MRAHHRPGVRRAVAGSVVVLSAFGLTVQQAKAVAGGPPSAKPAAGTPHLPLGTSSVEQIRQLVQCGSTMYAVGSFQSVVQGSQTYARNGGFSFSATAPYALTGWNPSANGVVNTVAFNGSDCSHAYLGGKFSSLGSTAVKNLAAVDTSTGAVIPSFGHSAAGQVETIVSAGGHLLTGGMFTSVNGSTAAPYFTSLDPRTGKDDGYLRLGISGSYSYTDDNGTPAASNPTRVYDAQLSHSGARLLVEGDFTTIGGQPRRQVAMLDLGATAVSTDAWHAPELDANCATGQPFYARSAGWSADDSSVLIATTGYKPANGRGFRTSDPRSGLCDVAAAFPASAGQVSHTWVNYTGCDSLYAVAADSSTVYAAGHERYASNPSGCDAAGPGAVSAPGLVGLSPSSGAVTFNPGRDRGQGADDILVTSAGVWIASDNASNADRCAGYPNHSGICFLPY